MKKKPFPHAPLVWFLLWAIPGWASAAIESYRSAEYDILFPQSRQGQMATGTAVQPEIAPPLEAPIDPRSYRMAPGDLLQLEVGGETDRSWRLAVSAEGQLLLPGSSAIDTNGKTLAGLTEAVRAELSPRFPGKPIGLFLLQPGAFRVPVTGQVAIPGIHPLHSYDRVLAALTLAGGPIDGASIRQIIIRSADGSSRTIDLVRFALLGELDQNPFLEPGMSIQVGQARDFVLVTGAIHGRPGDDRTLVPTASSRIPETPNLQLEWKDGDTGRFAITRAGGLSQDADGTILLLRGDGRQAISLAATDTLRLQPGDILEASMRERWVYVSGAVRYPGPYPHLPSYRAADYVRIAGGPNEFGRGGGWTVKMVGSEEAKAVGAESYVPPGSAILVPEKRTYQISSVLAPVTAFSALIISIVALSK